MTIRFDSSFIRRYARTQRTNKHPILFFHSFDGAGQIALQGYIYYLDKDGCGLAYTFDWLFGQRSEESLHFTKAFLSECVFYSTDHEWRRHAHDHREGLDEDGSEARLALRHLMETPQ